MRLTCLVCGHQVDMAQDGQGQMAGACSCGEAYVYPGVVDMGVRPNLRAAERLRSRAFRAAGTVRNVGGFALMVSLIGIVFFPVGLVGAMLGLYTLLALRGPIGRYSGRTSAVWALGIGLCVFTVESHMAVTYYHRRKLEERAARQEQVVEDLQALQRTQHIFFAKYGFYGSFAELEFRPPNGAATLFLGGESLLPTKPDVQPVKSLPPQAATLPSLAPTAFTAVAAVGLSEDGGIPDMWAIDAKGSVTHLNPSAAAP